MDPETVDESSEAFASQFDKGSPTFHNGDPTPVPLLGERVPESMPTAYDPSSFTDQVDPLHPDYTLLKDLREGLVGLKKAVTQVCTCLEAKLRAKRIRDGERRAGALAEQQEKLEESLAVVMSYGELLQQGQGIFAELYEPLIEGLIARAQTEYANKTEYGEFMSFVATLTSKIFKDTSMLLGRLKFIKKVEA